MHRAYLSGVLSNLLNPKIGVFFVTFLPGFVPAGAPIGATAALLGALFVVGTELWLLVLVWLVGHGTGWLSRPRRAPVGRPGHRRRADRLRDPGGRRHALSAHAALVTVARRGRGVPRCRP